MICGARPRLRRCRSPPASRPRRRPRPARTAPASSRPLSAFLHQTAPPAAPAIDFPPFDKDLAKLGFFEFLDFALQFAQAQPVEKEIRARLATIGIGPGRAFRFKDLSHEDRLEVALGMRAGNARVDAAVAHAGKRVNNWQVSALFGDGAHYDGDWLMRAAAARGGIYGNDGVEAMYPLTRSDRNGRTLDGASHRYTLTFPAGQLPPVNAFWSLTMYDSEHQLLVKNPIDRYLINSPDAAGHEDECRRIADPVHPECVAGTGA